MKYIVFPRKILLVLGVVITFSSVEAAVTCVYNDRLAGNSCYQSWDRISKTPVVGDGLRVMGTCTGDVVSLDMVNSCTNPTVNVESAGTVDNAAPSCTVKSLDSGTMIGANIWYKDSVKVGIDTCTDNLSGCRWDTRTNNFVLTHNGNASISIEDFAGNSTTCTSSNIKIDSAAPNFYTGTKLLMRVPEDVTARPDNYRALNTSTVENFRADDLYHFKLLVRDDVATGSGASGLDIDSTRVIIKSDNSVEPDIDFKISDISAFSANLLGGNEGIYIKFQNAGILEKVGEYQLQFVVSDKVGNQISTGDFIKIKILAGNVVSANSTINRLDGVNGEAYGRCGLANDLDSCELQFDLRDEFDNFILKVASVFNFSVTTPICSVNFSAVNYALPNSSLALNWDCADALYTKKSCVWLDMANQPIVKGVNGDGFNNSLLHDYFNKVSYGVFNSSLSFGSAPFWYEDSKLRCSVESFGLSGTSSAPQFVTQTLTPEANYCTSFVEDTAEPYANTCIVE